MGIFTRTRADANRIAVGQVPQPPREVEVAQPHPVEHLLQYAETNRMSIPIRRQHVENLAESMRQHGYDSSKGSEHLLQQHQYRDLGEAPVQLHYTDQGGFLHEGNHRVHAASMAGLEHLPAVVRDFRTNKDDPPPRPGAWL